MKNEVVRVEGLTVLRPEEPIAAVMETLATDGKLPVDFQFRLSMVDEEERAAVATQDILAAMGHSNVKRELPHYLLLDNHPELGA